VLCGGALSFLEATGDKRFSANAGFNYKDMYYEIKFMKVLSEVRYPYFVAF
jgi:hypothetical protein